MKQQSCGLQTGQLNRRRNKNAVIVQAPRSVRHTHVHRITAGYTFVQSLHCGTNSGGPACSVVLLVFSGNVIHLMGLKQTHALRDTRNMVIIIGDGLTCHFVIICQPHAVNSECSR